MVGGLKDYHTGTDVCLHEGRSVHGRTGEAWHGIAVGLSYHELMIENADEDEGDDRRQYERFRW